MNLSKIDEALDDFKQGKFLIVIDDRHRENEADFVVAAEKITPQKVNFMIKNGMGLVCVPMLGKRLDELKLPLMVKNNTEYTKCAFTVSVDAKKGTTTGISAFDRAKTIMALADKNSKSADFAKPGHVFPLRCDAKGLRSRAGHTEATIELCRLAGMQPAAVICEIIGRSGKMAKGKELQLFARKHNIGILMIKDLIRHCKQNI